MDPKHRDSQFVRHLMPNASETEIAEATRVWFSYLQLLDSCITETEAQSTDSRNSETYDRVVDNLPPP